MYPCDYFYGLIFFHFNRKYWKNDEDLQKKLSQKYTQFGWLGKQFKGGWFIAKNVSNEHFRYGTLISQYLFSSI